MAQVEVTQADQLLFKMVVTGMVGPTKHNAIDGGGFDSDDRMQYIARHRIDSSEAMEAENRRLRAALTVLYGVGKNGSWLAITNALAQRFDVAAKFGGDAVHNAEGSAAIAELIRSMASRLDTACDAARTALNKSTPDGQ